MESESLDREGVLNGEVATTFSVAIVEMLVPHPHREAEHVALFPVNAFPIHAVPANDRVTGARDNVDNRLSGVAMVNRGTQRWKFA